MKFVKLSIVALCLGVFVTSCGDSKPAGDAGATATAPATTEAAAPATTAKVDTMNAGAAKPAADTTKK